MGNSSQIPSPALTIKSFHHCSVTINSEIIIEEFRSLHCASSEEKYFLIYQILPCFIHHFPSFEDFSVLIQEYFYSPICLNSILYIFRQVSNNQIVGFGIFNNFELKLLPDDERNENKYIAVNGFGCISKEARGKSLQRNFFTYRAWSDTEYFPNRNVLMIDVCINPLSYLGMCQSTKVLFPRYNVRTPEGIEKLLAQTMQIAEYERFEDNDNPFLVKDPFQASEDLTGKFRKNQENLHEDIKFYNQVTEFRKNSGIAFVAVVSLVDGNTLGFPGGFYTAEASAGIDYKKYDFNQPKI